MQFQSNDRLVPNLNSISSHEPWLWDLLLACIICTATFCLSLHQAGLNAMDGPISIEYANGNVLAKLFFLALICTTLVAGALYRIYRRNVETVLMVCLIPVLTILILSKPHTSIHFFAYYVTVAGTIVAPLLAMIQQKSWILFVGVSIAAISTILLSYWDSISDPENSMIGIVQRIWVLLALLSNLAVLFRLKIDFDRSRHALENSLQTTNSAD